MTHLNIGQHHSSQHRVNIVEKVYHTSKWTYFSIEFFHPNYIFFVFDEKHEDFDFREGIHEFFRDSWIFSRFSLKAFISIRMTLGTIQNDYFDYVRHVWDIFGTIRPLKIIFWDYIFENFRLKMNKNTFFGILWLYKGNYYLFKLRNEEFRCLRSE